ncbi:MAG: hypothetical protein PHD06_01720 [Bacteroidales bacterium]|jgi:hypothetical protein|nr:hypothetical protein [Bacteroidales bacterium]MDD4383877.1 hypothetical protein [Bacteroidales bacterium]MDY0196456.1 hypothetical protein [Tenuifilaceae bacterium]
MKKISFTKSEVQNLRDIYQDELNKAIKRIEHLSAVLEKIDANFEAPAVPVIEEIKKTIAKPVVSPVKKSAKKISPKPKLEQAKPAVTRKKRKPIKRGSGKSKIQWNDFVLDTIAKIKKPVKSSDLTNEAVVAFKAKEADVPRLKQAVSVALSKLVTTEKKLIAKKLEGSREKMYGLKEWYDDKGNLLKDFK